MAPQRPVASPSQADRKAPGPASIESASIEFHGVVLAGGASRRMGRDKALIEIDGRPMATIAADALRHGGARSVCCVGGDAAALGALGLDVRPDRFPGQGPLGGLLTALDQPELRSGGALLMVLTCDLPRVDAGVVTTAVGALAGRPEAAIAAPVVDGRAQFLTAAYRPGLVRPAAQAAFAAGERAMRRGLAGLAVLEVVGLDLTLLEDADTPDALPAPWR